MKTCPAPGMAHHDRPAWQPAFLTLLPEIRRRLKYEFRGLQGEARQEAIQEGVANCLVRFENLHRHGRGDAASAGSLAKFAARQIRSGRLIATRMNVRDPLSRYAQIRKRITVESLDQEPSPHTAWIHEALTARTGSIPDQVALRIDVPDWLKRLTRRTQRIARDMALGWSTGELAGRYRLSPARISQLRRELSESWAEYQGLEGAAA